MALFCSGFFFISLLVQNHVYLCTKKKEKDSNETFLTLEIVLPLHFLVVLFFHEQRNYDLFISSRYVNYESIFEVKPLK